MFTTIITCAMLILANYAQEIEDNSVLALNGRREEAKKILDSLDLPPEVKSVFFRNICSLNDEDWKILLPLEIQLINAGGGLNSKTGTVNFTALTPEGRKNMLAAQCDEQYKMEKDMNSKLGTILKGYMLRGAHCVDLPGYEESCKLTSICHGEE